MSRTERMWVEKKKGALLPLVYRRFPRRKTKQNEHYTPKTARFAWCYSPPGPQRELVIVKIDKLGKDININSSSLSDSHRNGIRKKKRGVVSHKITIDRRRSKQSDFTRTTKIPEYNSSSQISQLLLYYISFNVY